MTLAKTLTYKQLEEVVKTYVDSNKISVDSFEVTKNNIVGLVDTIGKIFTLENNVEDKLPEFDGENLEFGKTIEEWQMDMTLPIDYDEDVEGNKSLKDYTPTARKVDFSFSLGRKILPTSIPSNNFERAVHNRDQAVAIATQISKKMEDSKKAYKYQCKRQVLGTLIKKILDAYNNAIAYTANSTVLEIGKYYKSGSAVAVAMFDKAKSADTWDTLVANGKLVVLALKEEIAIPTDETTGEDFLIAVKKDIEIGKDISEGHSLNGVALGGENHLRLYYKQGIVPSLAVKTRAGAFNLGELETAPSKVIKDFGADTSNTFAILLDDRILRLHEDYNVVREQSNAFADRISLFNHLEYTAHISRNAFVKIYVAK